MNPEPKATDKPQISPAHCRRISSTPMPFSPSCTARRDAVARSFCFLADSMTMAPISFSCLTSGFLRVTAPLREVWNRRSGYREEKAGLAALNPGYFSGVMPSCRSDCFTNRPQFF